MMRVVVVGAGVIGLTTALVLRQRGLTVRIVARERPEDTVSAVAGAIWYPFLAEPRQRVLRWSALSYRRLAELALDATSGVVMREAVEVFASDEPDLWWAAAAGPVVRVPASEVEKPYAAAIRVRVPVCDVPRHLPWLLRQVEGAGVTFEWRALAALDEAFDGADVVVNCTGLGAAALCGDGQLQPVRGQIVTVPQQQCEQALIDDTASQPFYVIPRGDDIVLGGTAQPGDSRLAVDDRDTHAILAGIAARVPALRHVTERQVLVGLRPYRRSVRLELERISGRSIVHNYGHGGSGYTLAFGCAEEVASLVTLDGGVRPAGF